MDKKTLAHLFEPFYYTKGVGEGTGLGLATVYGIVKQNNGFVNVYSEPGHGAVFKIYLPRRQGDPAVRQNLSAPEMPSGKGKVVLIVEDEVSILRMGVNMLKRLDYKVLAASSPSEALRLARDCHDSIHLLITDVIMPEMNGRELVRKMQSMRPDIKVLFMSGYTAHAIAPQGVLDEGMLFIQKPFSMAHLAAKAHEALHASS